MSRISELLERLEAVAKRLGVSVEDAILILEGRHPTQTVVQKYKDVAPAAASAVKSTADGTQANPIISGPAAVSAGSQVSNAATTGAVGANNED